FFGQDFVRPIESCVDVGTNIFPAETVQKPCAVHRKERLRVRAAQNQVFSLGVKLLVQALQGVESGGVHRQHLAHTEDENVGFLPGSLEGGLQFVRGAEKERAE